MKTWTPKKSYELTSLQKIGHISANTGPIFKIRNLAYSAFRPWSAQCRRARRDARYDVMHARDVIDLATESRLATDDVWRWDHHGLVVHLVAMCYLRNRRVDFVHILQANYYCQECLMPKFNTICQTGEPWQNILYPVYILQLPWKPMPLASKLDRPRPACKVWCRSVKKRRSSFRTNIQTPNSNYSMIT